MAAAQTARSRALSKPVATEAVKVTWVRPKEALKVFPGGLTTLYRFMNEGRVENRKVDGMRLVNIESAANPK